MSTLGEHWAHLLADLERGFELLRELPPAVTFFGGARIREDDPAYALSQEIGKRLAEAKIPPRTGAGPGIMTSVPEGYKAAVAGSTSVRANDTGAFTRGMVDAYARRTHRMKALQKDPDSPHPPTQGVKILLPFEPETNESIDQGVDMATFPIRRLMLYENSLGLVVFPGGFGTLDELFEVWSRRRRAHHRDPIVMVGTAFFGPLLRALRAVLLDGERTLVERRLLDDVLLTDDPGEVVDVFRDAELIGFDEQPEAIARRMTHELPFVAGVLRRTQHAVTFLGGATLDSDDPAIAVASGILKRLAAAGTPARIGHHGTLASLVHDLYQGKERLLQGFFLSDEDDVRDDRWSEQQSLQVSDPIAHKLLLTKATLGFLVLPGDMRTLDEVFSVLCEIQTGKMQQEHLVLVGSSYWQPILDACAEVMLTEQRQTISPEDMDLATVVDSVDAALEALGLQSS